MQSQEAGPEKAGPSDLVKSIADNLGQVFRYILPGITIVGAAAAAHPVWFRTVEFGNPWHLLGLGAVALAAGNTWYALHRYGIHQVIDMILYACGVPGPADSKPGLPAVARFIDGLARHVVKAYEHASRQALRQHVALRAASMHLLYITAEASIFFSVFADDSSFFGQHRQGMFWAGLVVFTVATWQNLITRRIDYYSVEQSQSGPQK
jgi:hypothetical protein